MRVWDSSRFASTAEIRAKRSTTWGVAPKSGQAGSKVAAICCMPSTRSAAIGTSGAITTGIDAFQMRALEIVTSGKVRDAFDVEQESARTRLRYGEGPSASAFIQDACYCSRGG